MVFVFCFFPLASSVVLHDWDIDLQKECKLIVNAWADFDPGTDFKLKKHAGSAAAMPGSPVSEANWN